jgi:chromosome segregation ATPase
VSKLQKQNDDAKEAIKGLTPKQEVCKGLKREKQKVQSKVKQLKDYPNIIEDEKNESESELGKLQKKNEDLENIMDKLQEAKNELTFEVGTLDGTVKKLQSKIDADNIKHEAILTENVSLKHTNEDVMHNNEIFKNINTIARQLIPIEHDKIRIGAKRVATAAFEGRTKRFMFAKADNNVMEEAKVVQETVDI